LPLVEVLLGSPPRSTMLEAAKDLVEERVGLLSVMRAPATASQRAREESDAVEEKQQRATREGFALGRVVWFGCEGDYGRDFLFHVANGHTLVSLLRGHSMHPFERFDRACYLACVLCLNLFLSALVARDHAPATRKGNVSYAASGDYAEALCAASLLNLVYDRALRLLATSPCAGQEKGDSTSLQRECFARARSRKSVRASRALREMIARPKISRNEWRSAEKGAFEIENFAPFSCPGPAWRAAARATTFVVCAASAARTSGSSGSTSRSWRPARSRSSEL
jgi:hypothetical protein